MFAADLDTIESCDSRQSGEPDACGLFYALILPSPTHLPPDYDPGFGGLESLVRRALGAGRGFGGGACLSFESCGAAALTLDGSMFEGHSSRQQSRRGRTLNADETEP